MGNRRANPCRVKRHYSYTTGELATALDVHKNTIRHWQRAGLEPIDTSRPLLFHGEAVRAFLTRRNTARKSPCPPGTIYCLRCRQPRQPALGMVDYVPMKLATGNLRALCETCGSMMHRRVRETAIASVMPGCTVQIVEGHASLNGQRAPSVNCDLEQRG